MQARAVELQDDRKQRTEGRGQFSEGEEQRFDVKKLGDVIISYFDLFGDLQNLSGFAIMLPSILPTSLHFVSS